MTLPKHPGYAEWIDYARGSLSSEQTGRIESHIHTQCPKCLKELAFWSRVWRIAQEEAKFSPPEDLFRSVRVSSAQYLPKGHVRLIFDSWREALPAMIRSGGTSTRHLIYQVGPVLLDLQTQPASDGQRLSVVGQLMSKSSGDKGLGNAKVRVTAGERPLAETSTNQFGEFHLEFAVEQLEPVRLKAAIAPGNDIDIPFELPKA